MITIRETLVSRLFAETPGDHVALEDGRGNTLTYEELWSRVGRAAVSLVSSGRGRFGLQAGNGFDWVIADLAATVAGQTLVPLPGFFTGSQIDAVLESVGVDALLTDRGDSTDGGHPLDGTDLVLQERGAPAPPVSGTAKVTFTSGTTGAPKGTKLSASALEQVARSLRKALADKAHARHLCILPLAVLLENIGGVYRTLLAGGRVLLPSEEERGLLGSCRVDATAMLAALRRHRPTSLILMPAMLDELVTELERRPQEATGSLRFVGVGGAAVPVRLLERARAVGMPAFEGYGLSETASVVSLNVPSGERPGSVGRPLGHVRVRIAADGEIHVAGAVFEGYLGTRTGPAGDGYWPTGDLGYLDDEGFLFLRGRKRNVLVTAFGRNVSPEWVERDLEECTAVHRAVVVGDGQPGLAAVIVPSPGAEAAVAAQIEAVRAGLPDYARPVGWILTTEEHLIAEGLLTTNGRPRRRELENAFRAELDDVWARPTPFHTTRGDTRHGLLPDLARRDSI